MAVNESSRMLDGSLSLSSVYTSQHTCELSFLLCYEKQFVSSSICNGTTEGELEEVLLLHKDKGTKCCGVLTFANRTAHLVNVLGLGFFFLYFSLLVLIW